MDESDDLFNTIYNDLLNQHSFSCISSGVRNYKVISNYEKEEEEEEQLIATKIVYEKDTTSIIDMLAIIFQSEINVITDKNDLSLIIIVYEIPKYCTILKNNSSKNRIVTELNSGNKGYYKQIAEKHDVKLRHYLDVIHNPAILDTKEYVGLNVFKKKRPLSDLIYSKFKEIGDQNQFIFETRWEKNSFCKPENERD